MTDPFKLPSRATNPDANVYDVRPYGLGFVLQIGCSKVKIAHKPGRGVHSHPAWQITICTRGTVSFSEGERKWTLLPGRCLVLPPNAPHRMTGNKRGSVRYWMFLRPFGAGRILEGLTKEESDWMRGRFAVLTDRCYIIGIEDVMLLKRMVEVLESGGMAKAEKRIELRTLAHRFLLALSRLSDERHVECGDGRIKKIVSRMQKRPQDDYPIAQLVSESGLSATTLLRTFRCVTGKTPHEFLMACRLQKGMDALARTNRSVVDIAFSLGFASSQHFALAFRLHTGMTPRDWRRTNGKTSSR